MKTKQIKEYITVLAFCVSTILIAKLSDEAKYVEVYSKIACGLCLVSLIYGTKLILELQKENFQKTIALRP
ncbi:hypothetical protein [Flavobacterium nackdongense]|uniref:Uncharacterized protein n=1 Tax=Flavobacterium nackdongense TaxID=2547394 RepID=A0A4P6YDS6_9FLAO|nr:hypothetical protein [Flavobacterium nackdongense]QBN18560.1 hypothetical protein E1750_06970 [Flavobacterium nackdongense]